MCKEEWEKTTSISKETLKVIYVRVENACRSQKRYVGNRKMKRGIKIEVYASGDEEEILRLLSQAELPTEDLTIGKLENFLVARQEDGLVIGTIGVEAYQDVGLLRSLVIDPSYRGTGLGKQLVYELQSFAERKRIKTLFLLTISAADFFKKLGYEVIQRTLLPPPIAETEEFRNICPVSATCLFKNLKSS